MIFFIFQHAINGTERAVYVDLIVTFMSEMPRSKVDGFRRVCDESNYAYIGFNLFRKLELSSLSCQMMSLPVNSYTQTLTYIISNTSHYEGLINWK